MDIEEAQIGRRVREIRSWRRLSVTAVAGLAGMTKSYLSMIERGQRPVTKRATLEALAHALQVSPAELTGKPYAPADPISSDGHAALTAVEAALETYDLGTDPEIAPRPWPELAADLTQLEALRAQADYAGQLTILPGLMAELHAVYVRVPAHRRDAVVGLLYAYRAATVASKAMGSRGWPVVAARLAQTCAEELGTPDWLGYAAWLRGHASGSQSRSHQYALSVRAADQLRGSLDDLDALQVCGMLQLNAALACAAQGQAERMNDHLDEASDLARRLPEERERNGFRMNFGPNNVGVWRVSLGAELGEGAKVVEAARHVRLDMLPTKQRRGTFYMDLGRALASERRTREQGIQALIRAEEIAPQLVRNDVFVRETVAGLLAAARRDSGGRELRGLAHRMGVAPIG